MKRKGNVWVTYYLLQTYNRVLMYHKTVVTISLTVCRMLRLLWQMSRNDWEKLKLLCLCCLYLLSLFFFSTIMSLFFLIYLKVLCELSYNGSKLSFSITSLWIIFPRLNILSISDWLMTANIITIITAYISSTLWIWFLPRAAVMVVLHWKWPGCELSALSVD